MAIYNNASSESIDHFLKKFNQKIKDHEFAFNPKEKNKKFLVNHGMNRQDAIHIPASGRKPRNLFLG